MFPDGSDVVLVIRTAKTTATWYKTSNGYYITADSIGQEAIQAVRLVESDEEIARSAKARCRLTGTYPVQPAGKPPFGPCPSATRCFNWELVADSQELVCIHAPLPAI